MPLVPRRAQAHLVADDVRVRVRVRVRVGVRVRVRVRVRPLMKAYAREVRLEGLLLFAHQQGEAVDDLGLEQRDGGGVGVVVVGVEGGVVAA